MLVSIVAWIKKKAFFKLVPKPHSWKEIKINFKKITSKNELLNKLWTIEYIVNIGLHNPFCATSGNLVKPMDSSQNNVFKSIR